MDISWVCFFRGIRLHVAGWLELRDITAARLEAGQLSLTSLHSRSIVGTVQPNQ